MKFILKKRFAIGKYSSICWFENRFYSAWYFHYASLSWSENNYYSYL